MAWGHESGRNYISKGRGLNYAKSLPLKLGFISLTSRGVGAPKILIISSNYF